MEIKTATFSSMEELDMFLESWEYITVDIEQEGDEFILRYFQND